MPLLARAVRYIEKIDFVIILVLIVIFIDLFSVHYNYSGKYSVITSSEYQQAKNMRYPYPYFADEWYAIAFIKHSINSRTLPLKNPSEFEETPFVNLEFAFHSFLSEIVLLLNIDPLTRYTVLTLFSGLLICMLVYLFLRYHDVNKLSAAIACLSVLYITNGANLPGIWTLIPLIMGTIAILLCFFFISSNNKKMFFFLEFLTLLFYPPLFPFCAVAGITFFLKNTRLPGKENIKNILYLFIIATFVAVILSLSVFRADREFGDFFTYILSKLFPPTFPPNAIPQFLPWNIIPIPILMLSALGAFSVIKTRKIWLVSLLSLGIIYWISYSYTTSRFFLDFPRATFFTAILLTIIAGFGLDHLVKLLKKTNFFIGNNGLNYIQLGILILFLVLSIDYTKRDNWMKLTLAYYDIGETLYPAAPANKYLHSDDLRVFKKIKNQMFLSVPWKGTVIGAATDNYSWVTKAGTLTAHRDDFTKFMKMPCFIKYLYAKRQNIDYIYSPQFNCPDFKPIDRSSEGLYLYRFVNQQYYFRNKRYRSATKRMNKFRSKRYLLRNKK